MVYIRDESDTNRLRFIAELLSELVGIPAVSSLEAKVDKIEIVENVPGYVSINGEVRPEAEHGFFDFLETSREEMARFLYEVRRNRKELNSHYHNYQEKMQKKQAKDSARIEGLTRFLIFTGYDMHLFTEDLSPKRVYVLLKGADHPLLEEYNNPNLLEKINSDMEVIRTAYRAAYRLKREGKA